MTNTLPVLILPGLGNSGPEHWQSHWERRDPRARVSPKTNGMRRNARNGSHDSMKQSAGRRHPSYSPLIVPRARWSRIGRPLPHRILRSSAARCSWRRAIGRSKLSTRADRVRTCSAAAIALCVDRGRELQRSLHHVVTCARVRRRMGEPVRRFGECGTYQRGERVWTLGRRVRLAPDAALIPCRRCHRRRRARETDFQNRVAGIACLSRAEWFPETWKHSRRPRRLECHPHRGARWLSSD